MISSCLSELRAVVYVLIVKGLSPLAQAQKLPYLPKSRRNSQYWPKSLFLNVNFACGQDPLLTPPRQQRAPTAASCCRRAFDGRRWSCEIHWADCSPCTATEIANQRQACLTAPDTAAAESLGDSLGDIGRCARTDTTQQIPMRRLHSSTPSARTFQYPRPPRPPSP